MVLLFFIGIICGFCSSAPLGPINLWLANAVLEKGRNAKFLPYLSGVILSDLIFAGLAAWGFKYASKFENFSLYIALAGGLFLIFLGTMSIFRLLKNDAQDIANGKTTTYKSAPKEFVLGMILCISNPAFLLFWTFVMGTLNKFHLSPNTIMTLGVFLFGIAAGDYLWFRTLIELAHKGKEKLGNQPIFVLRWIIAILFIAVGILAIYKTL